MRDYRSDNQCAEIRQLCRNRYVYGKLLDVYHFELEQNYYNAKRSLINRLVCGFGVVCGLDVQPGPDGNSIVVSPGFALDKWGREMIVPSPSRPVAIPDATPAALTLAETEDCEDIYVHVDLCYHECLSDPVPVFGGDCDQVQQCTPGTICERYEISIEPGRVPAIETECTIPDIVAGGTLNYPALVNYITEPCGDCPEKPCIALANIRLTEHGQPTQAQHIDISVRPVVYSNDLLHDLLTCLVSKGRVSEKRGGKS